MNEHSQPYCAGERIGRTVAYEPTRDVHHTDVMNPAADDDAVSWRAPAPPPPPPTPPHHENAPHRYRTRP
jgi:hypothetical protein